MIEKIFDFVKGYFPMPIILLLLVDVALWRYHKAWCLYDPVIDHIVFYIMLNVSILAILVIWDRYVKSKMLKKCFGVLWDPKDFSAHCPKCRDPLAFGEKDDVLRCGEHKDLLLRGKEGVPISYSSARDKIEKHLRRKNWTLKNVELPF
jgi:hypothetical protein